MKTTAIAVRLKIPDNEAFTALSALRRLEIAVSRVERADVWIFESEDAAVEGLLAAIRANETLYNPNKHELAELAAARPRAGEVWVEEVGEDPGLRARLGGKIIPGVKDAKRYVGWRLFGSDDAPADTATAKAAAEALLCNPAIERAIL
jgi:phosphoribosylformylglycinamidine (FGAM) synthase PurS component